MKILLTEGAGLTSRQVATRLDALGHQVHAAVSDLVCLARFTRHVHALHQVPTFGEDPLAWFDHMVEMAVAQHIDLIFPTQEQVAVLSHQLPRLIEHGIATAVPPFSALVQVQDKLSAWRTLTKYSVPQPTTLVVRHGNETMEWSDFPAYVKAPVGTGSTGVRKVNNRAELADAVRQFLDRGALADGGVLVQQVVLGTFVMAQCVFQRGGLVAFHANRRVEEGANGSASAKESVDMPALRNHLTRLGRALDWHGALSVDAIIREGTPFVIDVNPRLVEPGNAQAAGTDLVEAMLEVCLGGEGALQPPSRAGVRTHQRLMAILGAAQREERRRDVLAELCRIFDRRSEYAASLEELLPPSGDRRTAILPVAAALATLFRPQLWRIFTDGAVARYALGATGWRMLRATTPLGELTPAAT
jgi:biotin carboxylase